MLNKPLCRWVRQLVYEATPTTLKRLNKSVVINGSLYAAFMLYHQKMDPWAIGLGTLVVGWALMDRLRYSLLKQRLVDRIELAPESQEYVLTMKAGEWTVKRHEVQVILDRLPLIECRTAAGDIFFIPKLGTWHDEELKSEFFPPQND